MAIERHHYVPQGFLKGFRALGKESDKFIWVYEKLPDRRPRCVSVKSIAWESFYYEQETETGECDSDTLERAFAETIDNKVPQIIRSIDAKAGGGVELTEDDQGALAFFLGISLTRVPSFRKGTRDFYTKIAQMTLDQVARNDPSIAEVIEEYGFKAEAKTWVSLKPMIQVAQAIAHSSLKKNWQFFVPPNGFALISSDNPVHFSVPREFGSIMAGPGHPLAELVINLRSNLALVCTSRRYGEKFPVIQMSKREAKKFNRGTARAAGRFIFANQLSDGIEKLTKKYAGEKQAIVI
ncbi:MAG: DUF4238 domain-containing protein [Candidatus Scalindua sp.]|jgi:hypothetical protein|nr:DUF4238 domain-containing protein [Candidatus Scalindua sp.]